MRSSARVVPKSKGKTPRVRYYGRRKAEKSVRCYHKKEVKAYRTELELHSGLLRRSGVQTIDDLSLLPNLLAPKHLWFVDFDWDKFQRFLRNTERPSSLLVKARRHRNSIHQLMGYLRRAGVPNPHRFLLSHLLNKEIRQALDGWKDQFFSEVAVDHRNRKHHKRKKCPTARALKLLRSPYFFFQASPGTIAGWARRRTTQCPRPLYRGCFTTSRTSTRRVR
jgi:hypothetical protein